jgi:peptidoglycan hydrolase-like protein with peptidoglycan-binding domain
MHARGWTIAVDGVYGPESYKVALAFQAEKGLARDGLVGKNTWDAAWTLKVTR